MTRFATYDGNDNLDETFNNLFEANEYLDEIKTFDPETYGDYYIGYYDPEILWTWESDGDFFILKCKDGREYITEDDGDLGVWELIQKIDMENGTDLMAEIDKDTLAPGY